MASQVLHFSVPAVCYFVSNNLSFYALRLLPAYTYMLLTSLKILTTALLSHTFLGKDIPAHQQVSYVLMLLAVNLGTAKSSSVSHSPYLSYNVPWGMLVMLAVAGCSALATVYTEWVMNYSCYKQESINLQNARLYVAGVVLNGGYYLWQAVSKEWSGGQTGTGGAWSDIRLLHWGIIISLAFMGLLVSVIIKWHGSGVKVMASATAMFASAWASQVFLGEAAPGLFWLGAAAAAAALLLHSSLIPLPGSSNGEVVLPGVDSDSEGGRKKRGVQLLWAALVVTMAVAAFTAWNSRPPLPVSQQPAALSGQGPAAADTTPGASVAAAATAMAAAKAGAATGHRRVSSSASNASRVLGEMPHDANLRVPAEFLPIDYPGNRQVCADLTCSLDASCTADDPACCTYFHVRLLDFFNRFTAAYGLEREWFVVYGIVLGAVRHPGGFLPWTNDVDLGTSPRLINFLESTAVRDELWQYGGFRGTSAAGSAHGATNAACTHVPLCSSSSALCCPGALKVPDALVTTRKSACGTVCIAGIWQLALVYPSNLHHEQSAW
jgi:probable UDP-sugar transporter A4